MAMKYSHISSICLILCANSVVGHMSPGSSYNFPESGANDAEMFSIPPRPNSEVRLSSLRAVMVEEGVQAYIVPTTDAHNSLLIAPVDARQAWLTGYENAAVTAVVTSDHALAWIGRIHVPQFELEANTTIWKVMREGIDLPVEDWLAQNLPSGSVVAVDPLTCTRLTWTTLEIALRPANITLLAKPDNLVDTVRRKLFDGPPARPINPLLTLPQTFAGRSASNKISEIVQEMHKVGASALVLTALDDIAWTLNLRGSDIPYFPVVFSYLIIRTDTPRNDVILFLKSLIPTENLAAQLEAENQPIRIRLYESIFDYLSDLSTTLEANGRSIWVPATASHAVFQAIERAPVRIIVAPASPVALMKIIKNPVELEGFRQAHIRDGVAMIRALCWIDQQIAAQNATSEMQISNMLTQFRRDEQHFRGTSGASIVGAGENGAIFHYRPSYARMRTIRSDDMLLLDSGGQYLDGTTDITRTRHMGNCTEAQRRAFTRVMKGNINLSTSLFPRGTKGHTIDALARKYLWDIGLDYAHNTGHGLGHYLKIHEFPPRINSEPQPNDPGVAPGMIYSNEPGYYELGQYGVRHEDILETIAVTSTTNHPRAADLVGDFGGQGVVGFSAITQVPYQTSCLNVTLMTEFEIKYLNDFHAKIFRTIGPILQRRNLMAEYAWLKRECQPINNAAILEITSFLAAISIVVIWLGM